MLCWNITRFCIYNIRYSIYYTCTCKFNCCWPIYNQLSQTDAIDASNLSAEEKAELKKALKEVEKFEKEMNKTIEQVKHKNTKVQSAKYNKDTAINRNKGKEIEKERD